MRQTCPWKKSEPIFKSFLSCEDLFLIFQCIHYIIPNSLWGCSCRTQGCISHWKSNLRTSRTDFWKCSIHRNTLQTLSQQMLAILRLCGRWLLWVCPTAVLWRPSLLNTAHSMLYPCMTITRIMNVDLYFPERVCLKLKAAGWDKENQSVKGLLRVFGACSCSPGFMCSILISQF